MLMFCPLLLFLVSIKPFPQTEVSQGAISNSQDFTPNLPRFTLTEEARSFLLFKLCPDS